MKPRLIRASAGTGKTFRLSLEYIGLLIKYREELNFEEIVVITFTRKATYEIRERIITFLSRIVNQSDDHLMLSAKLHEYYEDIVVDDEVRTYLQQVYQQIITNKSRLNISTLDSFINQIFKSLIAPYYNIAEYDIDPQCNDKILPKLYDVILQDDNYKLLNSIFQTTHSRQISNYDKFIKKILDDRWLFEFYWRAEIPEIQSIAAGEKALASIKSNADELFYSFADLITNNYADLPFTKIINKDWQLILAKYYPDKEPETLEIASLLRLLFENEDFLINENKLIAKVTKIWNGKSIITKKKFPILFETFQDMANDLAQSWQLFLYYRLAIPEQNAILQIASLIFERYDEIKFREKVFTYSDLSTYTWKYLYDDAISIIDNNEVINIFYEQLAYRIRFILIDEFQDTSILQWNIFSPLINEILAGNGVSEIGSAIIVGDEKQAIYAWRSGERELLKRMESIITYPFFKDTLEDSYRSSNAIIDSVNMLFGSDYFKDYAKLLGWDYENVNCKSKLPGYCRFQITNLSRKPDKFTFENAVDQFITDTFIPAIATGKIIPAETAILTRSNNDIETICGVLREHKIPFINEAGRSLIKHRAIKPLVFLLKWFNNFDLYNLVLFLRSDMILIDSTILKQILALKRNLTKDEQDFSQRLYSNLAHDPVVSILADLQSLCYDPLLLIKTAIRKFNLINIFNQETDFVNLQKFLDRIAEYFSGQPDFLQNISGLLLHLAEKESSEEFSQAGIQQQNAVKVMTVHKSKGLEFDTVVFMLKNSRAGNHGQSLEIFPAFDPTYSQIEDCFFSFNFAKYLDASPQSPLAQNKNLKDTIEEINIWYVALTRPKRNLYTLYCYESVKGLEKHLEEFAAPKLNTGKLMIHCLINEFSSQIEETEYDHIIETGTLETFTEKDEPDIEILPSSIDVSEWFDASVPDFKEIENWQLCLNPLALKAEAKAKLMGNLAHYYLQQIEFDDYRQREMALIATINYYGNLISQPVIKDTCSKVDSFLDEHNHYFAENKWDIAYREYAIYNGHKEFRVDRLLISHSRSK